MPRRALPLSRECHDGEVSISVGALEGPEAAPPSVCFCLHCVSPVDAASRPLSLSGFCCVTEPVQ